ncbi:SdpI family protein [uncultured Clostridium sp.]|uniref:SdpI family protein n=1 Tax=uncultured Clostridium sp. TaxID=59620 RepID=UPI0026369E2B|nr:SdpI family protein [uncultured Clostridium sp.]
MNLSSGIILFFIGILLIKFHTKEPSTIGYKIGIAKKNEDTWNTAQKVCGIGLIIVGVLNILFFIFIDMTGKFDTSVIINGFLICTVVISVIIDEIYLNMIFDAEGNRK